MLANWREDYNTVRPHSQLDDMPPRPLSFHQPQAMKNGNSPFEGIQKGGARQAQRMLLIIASRVDLARKAAA
ncbi:hypothetical protein CFR80_15130 [Komagataeibacter oboediens]|uniref:Integrase catalytic domain-containing protein n=1 Tax=Komagataeibacter oboediens TaxID=65958 RepID=A0A318QI79_9PROT|nr:hypothetical protein CFR80_15130 [Komagataeibacter oboediens]